MPASFKCEFDGTEIKVRRLVWKEMKELQKSAEDGTGLDDMEATLAKVIIEPKNWEEKLNGVEVRKVFNYAWGIAETIE